MARRQQSATYTAETAAGLTLLLRILCRWGAGLVITLWAEMYPVDAARGTACYNTHHDRWADANLICKFPPQLRVACIFFLLFIHREYTPCRVRIKLARHLPATPIERLVRHGTWQQGRPILKYRVLLVSKTVTKVSQ